MIGDLAGEGEATGGNSGGAVKIAISWRRLIRPDGSQFDIGGANSADAQGRSGVIGYLDEQLLKRYSMPLLTSMLQNATAYVMASGSGSKNTDTSSTEDARSQAAEDARQNFISQMDQIFQEILQRKASIQSVTYVPAGTRIIIFPRKDLWLNSEDREKRNSGEGNGDGGYNESGLVDKNPGKERGGSNVTYSGNYNENVSPVSGDKPQQVNTGRSPTGYNPPASIGSTQPPVVPESNSGGSDGVPELI